MDCILAITAVGNPRWDSIPDHMEGLGKRVIELNVEGLAYSECGEDITLTWSGVESSG